MLKVYVTILFAGIGIGVYSLASTLSSDAIGMFLGTLFGLITATPALALSAVTVRKASLEAENAYALGFAEGLRQSLAIVDAQPPVDMRLADDMTYPLFRALS